MMWAVGMAWQRRAGKQSPRNKGVAGELSRQMVCPAQALKKHNSPQMAGLAAKQQPQTTLAGLSPCSAGRWRECGGAGTQEAGSDLPTLSLPHLSPLPVTVSTHSLNLYKPNLAPTYFFVFIIFIPFTSPLKICPLTPFNVLVRLTYLSLAYSQPLRSLPRGE